jgi:8-amino-7-oxononanoate synthase
MNLLIRLRQNWQVNHNLLIMDFFLKKINELKDNFLYRQLKISDNIGKNIIRQNEKDYISFSSNDYLGLSQNQEVKKAAKEAIDLYGFGSGGSRYVTGNNSLHKKLEKKIANLKNADDAIIFGSGYLAGVSAIDALMAKADLILADKLIHSCLIDGAKLSKAKILRFKHNDINHAKEILEKQRSKYAKCLIITETVFSMDGDLGKIDDLLKLAFKFDCLMMSDDAHGLGIIKKTYDKKYQDIYLQMGTFSKAVGGYGGYICASNVFINYLRNYAKSAIYSTALPPAILAGNLKALEIIENDNKLANKTFGNVKYLCDLLQIPQSQSAIIIIKIGEAKKALEIAKEILDLGYIISAIRYPTVEKDQSRLRITLNANHEKSDIKKVADFISNLSLIK